MTINTYAVRYIDKDGYVRDFSNIREFVENVRDIDKRVENLTAEISKNKSSIEEIAKNIEEKSECACDSKISSINSQLNSMKLNISSNSSAMNSLKQTVTTNSTNVSTLNENLNLLTTSVALLEEKLTNIEATLKGIQTRTKDWNIGVVLWQADGENYYACNLYDVVKKVYPELLIKIPTEQILDKDFKDTYWYKMANPSETRNFVLDETQKIITE